VNQQNVIYDNNKSNKSNLSIRSEVSDNKISTYVKTLKNELEKERNAKNNALNILKGLKHKD